MNEEKFQRHILQDTDVALVANIKGEMFLSMPETSIEVQHCQLVVPMLYILYSKDENLRNLVEEKINEMINIEHKS